MKERKEVTEMKKCLLCKAPIDDHRDFCARCYQRKISEIEQMMEKKKGPSSDPAKDIGEAPTVNPKKRTPPAIL